MVDGTQNTGGELYPRSIVDWEMKHGIVREKRDGVMYIRCTDLDHRIHR